MVVGARRHVPRAAGGERGCARARRHQGARPRRGGGSAFRARRRPGACVSQHRPHGELRAGSRTPRGRFRDARRRPDQGRRGGEREFRFRGRARVLRPRQLKRRTERDLGLHRDRSLARRRSGPVGRALGTGTRRGGRRAGRVGPLRGAPILPGFGRGRLPHPRRRPPPQGPGGPGAAPTPRPSRGAGFSGLGGPGEGACTGPAGRRTPKGGGPQSAYCPSHSRQSGTLLAIGADPINAMRQMKNTATDPYSGGRNFVGHYSIREWNVVPVSSPIEVQYSIAPGTAIANKRAGGRGITIVTGGDAGTAEGDFSTCLVWSSRPANPLPVLMIVTNNKWGISTHFQGQHGEKRISDRGKAFGIESKTIDGNDPEVSYRELSAAMEYVRTERRPFLLEAMVSRLYGHSSASGANRTNDEADCIAGFERRLEERGLLTRQQMDELRAQFAAELLAAHKQIKEEPQPDPKSMYEHVLADRDLVRGDE